MSRYRRVSPVDPSAFSTVVTCPQCEWREITGDPSHAWFLLARHLKRDHGDIHASRTARRNYQRLNMSDRG